jgi:hypothetical protein
MKNALNFSFMPETYHELRSREEERGFMFWKIRVLRDYQKKRDNHNYLRMQMFPTEIQEYVKDIDYPAIKDEVVEKAEAHGAPKEIVEKLRSLPDQEFSSPMDIVQHMGDDAESEETL